MSNIEGQVLIAGDTNYSNGDTAKKFAQGRQGQALVAEVHGKFYEQAISGQVFSQAATPLGLAIPIYTATALAGGMPIWNPLGSGKNVVLIDADFGYGSGTAAYASIGLMARSGCGSAIATGSQITAFAEVTPKNALLGAGNVSVAKSSNAGTVTATAGVAAEWVRTLASINLEAQTGTAHGLITCHYEFDGKVIVPPGTMVWFAATLASVALYASSVSWYEAPIPA